MNPQPVPQDEYIENLWQSVREGLITWQELADLQATYLRDRQPVSVPTIQEIRARVRREGNWR